jgi:hypothetical protein
MTALPTLTSFFEVREIQVLPMYLQPVLSELWSYSSLEPGWDGPNSISPSKDSIERAQKFLVALDPKTTLPEPMVSADGIIGWFWDSPDMYFVVEFASVDLVRYYGKKQDLEIMDTFSFDGRSVPIEIAEFLG